MSHDDGLFLIYFLIYFSELETHFSHFWRENDELEIDQFSKKMIFILFS